MVCSYIPPRNTHDGAPFPHPHGGNGRAFTRRDKAWFRCPVMALIIAGETMQATDHFNPACHPSLPHLLAAAARRAARAFCRASRRGLTAVAFRI